MLDFQGPIELLCSLSLQNHKTPALYGGEAPPYAIETEYLSHSLEPLQPNAGPTILPSKAYDDVKEGDQYDILLIPGGEYTSPAG